MATAIALPSPGLKPIDLLTNSREHGKLASTKQTKARTAAQDFEAFYDTQRCATSTEVQGTSTVLVISVDGKGVPMRKADLRTGTREAAEAQQPTGHRQRKPGERAHTKRMATVAAV